MGCLSEIGCTCPLGAHTASGVRPLEPTRIEGGDRRTRLHSESNRANRRLQRSRGIKERELSLNSKPATKELDKHRTLIEGKSIGRRSLKGGPARRNPVFEPAPNRAHAHYVNFAPLRTPEGGDRSGV